MPAPANELNLDYTPVTEFDRILIQKLVEDDVLNAENTKKAAKQKPGLEDLSL